MNPPGLPGPTGSPRPTRGAPTIPTMPSSTQSSAAPTTNNDAGATETDQPGSLGNLTNQLVLSYAAEAHRLGYFDENELLQLEHLTGQPAEMISTVSKNLYCSPA
jgi:hypothetical protein